MRSSLTLLASEKRARRFLGASAQSGLGTGAGYVALLLIAYDRLDSPWAISLVLAADLLPSMLLSPLLGAVADRFSRKACVVAADVVRAAALGGIAVVDDFALTVALATLVGLGNALYRPAGQAAIPGLVEEKNVPAAVALYGAAEDIGFTLGPALAAGLLLLVGPEEVTALNALTFLISALVLASVSFGDREVRAEAEADTGHRSLVREAGDGMRAAATTPGVRAVLVFSSVTLVFCGIFNVGELLFAETALGAGGSGFSLLVMVFGLGFLAGSLLGSRGGPLADLQRGYEAGLLAIAVGFIGTSFAPTVAAAAVTFAAAGFGNGLVLVYERLIIQRLVPDGLLARVYGVKDALTAWAFGLAFAAGGGLTASFDIRLVLLGAGIGSAVTAACAVVALRSAWGSGSGGSLERTRRSLAGEDRPNVFVARDGWLALLDDLDKRAYH